MVEGIQVMRAMWTDAPATFKGRYYQIEDAYCEPRPEVPIPIMIGGDGEQLTLKAVAEHAEWWNALMRPMPVLKHKLEVLENHCRAAGTACVVKRRRSVVMMGLRQSERHAAADQRLGAEGIDRSQCARMAVGALQQHPSTPCQQRCGQLQRRSRMPRRSSLRRPCDCNCAGRATRP